MKVNHELVLDILDKGLEYNDYDFCLPHLLDENEQYRQYFLDSRDNGRYIISDNSLHELGHAYDHDRLKYWINRLQPNEFIVPDVWENSSETLAQAKYWKQYEKMNKITFPDTVFVAVVQAKSFGECVNTYLSLKDLGYEKIAFSYGADWYGEFGSLSDNNFVNKSTGRIRTIDKMLSQKIIRDTDRIHLLGCSTPQEFRAYRGIKQIETIDTSNPIMAGIEGLKYTDNGLYVKPKTNLNSHFTTKLTFEQKELIKYNVEQFKKFI